jgi:hypothetical protein
VRKRLGCQPTCCWHAKGLPVAAAASQARSSPLWLACLEPVLAAGLAA